MARVCVQTELAAGADAAWELVQQSSTLHHVTRGLIGFEGELPERWEAGQDVTVRLKAFNRVPLNDHRLQIVSVDDDTRTIHTNESGGQITRWEHRITVDPSGPGRSLYTDAVELEAGAVTPFVKVYAEAFYRYRQRRLRRLARETT